MPKVNAQILSWARETAGLSPDQAVEKLGINDARGVAAVDRLAAIESGAAEPSRPPMNREQRSRCCKIGLPSHSIAGDRCAAPPSWTMGRGRGVLSAGASSAT